jgi:hypothetical protein
MYGIPMAAKVEVDCSSLSGMTSRQTTLRPPALTNQLVLG